MKKCPSCGFEADSKYCPECGDCMQPIDEATVSVNENNFVKINSEDEINVETGKEYDDNSVDFDKGTLVGNTADKTKTKIVEKTWFVILMLLLFFPVGAYFMWKGKKFNKGVRIATSAILGLNFLFWLFLIIVLLMPCPHEWQEATCTTPKYCTICEESEGEALGHTKGEWELTKEATLVDVGVEELLCSVCGESLDTRGTEKKKAKVSGSSFNFKDEEFIAWLEAESALEFTLIETNNKNTIYGIVNTNTDAKGLLLLNHGENSTDEEISLIGIHMFDNDTASMALITYVGEEISSVFSSDDAFAKLYYDLTYTKADMTTTMLELTDDSDYAVLAPSEFFEDILD